MILAMCYSAFVAISFSQQKARMRVAIVAGPYIPVPPKQYGGTEQVIHYLIKGLIEAGHEPVLFGPGDSEVPCELIPIVDKGIYFPARQAQAPVHEKEAQKILK